MTVDRRREIAERHGLPAIFAERLRGETRAALEADARALTALRRQQTPAGGPDAEVDYSGVSASGRALLDQLGLVATRQPDGLGFEDAHAKGLADLEAQHRADAARLRRRLGGDR